MAIVDTKTHSRKTNLLWRWWWWLKREVFFPVESLKSMSKSKSLHPKRAAWKPTYTTGFTSSASRKKLFPWSKPNLGPLRYDADVCPIAPFQVGRSSLDFGFYASTLVTWENASRFNHLPFKKGFFFNFQRFQFSIKCFTCPPPPPSLHRNQILCTSLYTI